MRAILITLCLLLLTACTHLQGPPAMYQPMCRHNAVYCALTAGEYCPVRIALGLYDDVLHAQAQAYIADTWQWLGIREGIVLAIPETEGFVNIRYLSLDDYLWRFEVRMGERWTEIE